MKNFAYRAGGRIEDAFVDGVGEMLIAGGTELLNWFRLGISEPNAVVDIGRIEGLDRIESDGETLYIGALATLASVGHNPLVIEAAPVLSQACLAAASPQIRNRATLGGNALQKTRCEYFRTGAPVAWPCNKRVPGSGCAALAGMNDHHAIFGWTEDCVATHPSDPVVALVALDAVVEIVGADGTRDLLVARLLRSQEEAVQAREDPATGETRLRPGELITGYRVPVGPKSSYVKIRERASFEYALVSAAAVVSVKDATLQGGRVVLGSVAQKPWPLALDLAGLAPSRDQIRPVIEAALEAARPLSRNAYKVRLAAGAATRAILEAAS